MGQYNYTIFILGAGASNDFGFSTGNSLVQIIYNLFLDKTSFIHPGSNQKSYVDNGINPNYAALLEFGFEFEFITRFKDELYKSQLNSIDSFLENRPEYIDIGKLAIALGIIPFENETALFQTDNNWMRYVWNRLGETLTGQSQKKIGFITFNYDRSLEHYLYIRLKNSLNLNDADCQVYFNNSIPIVHIYG